MPNNVIECIKRFSTTHTRIQPFITLTEHNQRLTRIFTEK